MDDGTEIESCAGRDAEKVLTPRPLSPKTPTWLKVRLAGETTEICSASPGETIVPVAGEVICRAGVGTVKFTELLSELLRDTTTGPVVVCRLDLFTRIPGVCVRHWRE